MLLDLKYIPFAYFLFPTQGHCITQNMESISLFSTKWKTQRNEAVGYSHPLVLKSHIIAIHYLPFRST